MAGQMKTAEKAPSMKIKPDIRDLRTTIEWFKSEGYLVETNAEVNPDLEITGIQKLMDGAMPILFNNVKGYTHLRAITNLFGHFGQSTATTDHDTFTNSGFGGIYCIFDLEFQIFHLSLCCCAHADHRDSTS